ncbi:MAG: hypothetical protein R2695_13400 [Acidimicrobiales bacterium]
MTGARGREATASAVDRRPGRARRAAAALAIVVLVASQCSSDRDADRVASTLTERDRTLTLESDTTRVVFDLAWGGAIREIWRDGENVVNNFDGGRLLAVSVYDGATTEGTEPGDTGWNPTPSDIHDHTNEPAAHEFEDGRLHLTARYLQWYPDNKGGGPSTAVPTEVVVETWAEFLDDPSTLHLTYRVTNTGSESHRWAGQEFPFAYVREPYRRFVTYAGDAPGRETR